MHNMHAGLTAPNLPLSKAIRDCFICISVYGMLMLKLPTSGGHA